MVGFNRGDTKNRRKDLATKPAVRTCACGREIVSVLQTKCAVCRQAEREAQ